MKNNVLILICTGIILFQCMNYNTDYDSVSMVRDINREYGIRLLDNSTITCTIDEFDVLDQPEEYLLRNYQYIIYALILLAVLMYIKRHYW